MGKYQDYCVTEIVDEVNNKYFLPHIQRPFVWSEDKILRLFDSLLRGYPIGTFLFWNIEKIRNRFEVRKRKFISNYAKEYSKNFNIEKLGLDDASSKENITLILDGQQRLQSLFIALNGKYEGKELYFNILSGEDDNEDGIKFEFDFFKEKGKGLEKSWVKVKDLTEKFRNPKTSIASVRKEIMLRLGEIDLEIEDRVGNNLEYLKNALFQKAGGPLSVYEEKDESEEGIFDIFVRVNSGGTPLSKSDLLFSFIKLTWKKFEAEKEFPNLLDKINSSGQFSFDIEFLLKNSLMTAGESVRYSIKTFSGENGKHVSAEIEANWDRISESITSVVDLIRDRFKITNDKVLSSAVSLVPLIYYAYLHKKDSFHKFEGDLENLETIRIWLINILLSRTFSGSSDSLLEITRKRFIDKISPKFKKYLAEGSISNALLTELNKKQSVFSQNAKITSSGDSIWEIAEGDNLFVIQEDTKNLLVYEKILDDLRMDKFPAAKINRELKRMGRITEIQSEMMQNIGYQSPESYLLLYLIYPYLVEFQPSNDKNFPQQDHIFSFHELSNVGRSEGDINRIGNIRLITKDENCWYKNDMPFEEFIKKSNPELLKTHLIPEYGDKGSGNFDWPVNAYDKFVQARENLLMQRIQKTLQ